jgi:hypothetical protein
VFYLFLERVPEKFIISAGRTAQLTRRAALRAELQPVFAGSFRVIGSSTSAPSAEVVMTAVVAMPTALGVCAWLQVAHGNSLSVLFVHITLPFFVVFWVVSVVPNIFSLRTLTAKV